MKFCTSCSFSSTKVQSEAPENAEQPAEICCRCLDIFNEPFIQSVASEVGRKLVSEAFDCKTYNLALRLPACCHLLEAASEAAQGKKSIYPLDGLSREKYRQAVAAILPIPIDQKSPLVISVQFQNQEADDAVRDFLQLNVTGRRGKKRRHDGAALSRAQMSDALAILSQDQLREFLHSSHWTSPSQFTISFARAPVFIAGRYCKFSRALPQSPWHGGDQDEEDPVGDKRADYGTSVAELVAPRLKEAAAAEACRFTASGREDVDVRMLGEGRPFALQLLNARAAAAFDDPAVLQRLGGEINKACADVAVKQLTLINSAQFDQLRVGQEEKRKTYTALCVSTVPVSAEKLAQLPAVCPLELSQRTPIRVLQRRPVATRQRSIFSMGAFSVSQTCFQLRLDTQAGTYVKEFVHGDFGRTRPSLAELLQVEGSIDLKELDVEGVELAWPPQ